MDQLRDWLAATITSELEAALDWKQQVLGKEVSHEDNLPYVDDDSNLRINCSKKGIVQICKVRPPEIVLAIRTEADNEQCVNDKKPYECTIADRSTRINATFAKRSTDLYEQKTKQRFTQDRPGCLIGLNSFEIVATHLGPRDQQLTLLVKDFTVLGAEGSSRIGQVPRAIETVDKEQGNLLKRLKDLRQDEGVQARSNYTSYANSTTTRSPSPNSSNSHDGSGSPARQDFATQATWSVPNGGWRNPAISSPERLRQNASSTKPSETLGLQKERTVEGSHTLHSEEELLKIIGDRKVKTIQSGEQSPNNPEASIKASSLTIKKTSGELQNSKMANGESTQHPPPVENPASKRQSGSHAKRLQRIGMREVKIPKDQEQVLNRDDAWIPPQPGQRRPFANIPISLLQQFNSEADRQSASDDEAAKEPDSHGHHADNDIESTKSSIASSSEDSDDAPLEWASSPDRNQLPPDSSAAATDQSDNEQSKSKLHRSEHQHKATVNASPAKQTNDRRYSSPANGSDSGRLKRKRDASLANASSQERRERMTIDAKDEDSQSSQESDIDISAPDALQEVSDSRINISSSTNIASTASQPELPYTQVKHTPFQVTSHQIKTVPISSGTAAVPDSEKRTSSAEKLLSCTPSCTSNSSLVESPIIGNRRARLPQPTEKQSQGANSKIIPRTDILEPRVPVRKPQSQPTNNGRVELERLQMDQKLEEQPQEASMNLTKALAQDASHRTKASASPDRKRPQSNDFQSAQSKRFRKLAMPVGSIVYNLPDDLPDPAIAARKHRQEWLAARRSSENSPNKEAPVSAQKSMVHEAPSHYSEAQIKSDLKDTVSRPSEEGTKSLQKYSAPAEQDSTGTLIHARNSMSKVVTGNPESEDSGTISTPNGDAASPETVPKQPITDALEDKLVLQDGQESHRSNVPKRSDTPGVNVPSPVSSPHSIFEQFRATYSDYNKGLNHFVALCRKISSLAKTDRPVRASRWDDFVIRHQLDYSRHIAECQETGEDALPFESFYNEMIDEPQYMKRILGPQTLKQVLSPDTKQTTIPPIIRAPSPKPETPNKKRTIIDLTDDDTSPFKAKQSSIQGSVQSTPSPKKPRPLFWKQDQSKSGEKPRQSPPPPSAAPAPHLAPLPQKTDEIKKVPRTKPSISRSPAKPKPISHKPTSKKPSSKYWEDPDSPYRTFRRAWASIHPGHGNAFAVDTATVAASTLPPAVEAEQEGGEGDAAPRHRQRPTSSTNPSTHAPSLKKLGDLNVVGWTL